MAKDVVWVRLDIAPFCMEVALQKGGLEDWTMSLARCLAEKNPALNEFGAKLLGEIEAYRNARAEDCRKRWDKKDGSTNKEPIAPNSTYKVDEAPNTNTSNDVVSCCITPIRKATTKNTVPAREIPESLTQIQGFPEAWADWAIYRKEIKKSLTPSTIKAQLNALAKLPNPVGSIRQSIENGWAGLFAVKEQQGGRTTTGRSAGFKNQFDHMNEFGDWVRNGGNNA